MSSLHICPPPSPLSPLLIPPPRTRFGKHHLLAQRWSSTLPTPDRDALVPTKVLFSTRATALVSQHPRQKAGPIPSTISTLDPSKYSVKDIVDISGLTRKYATFTVFGKPGCRFCYKSYGSARSGGQQYIPFPPNSKGIFYFHDQSSVHPAAGEIRFRLLPMDRVKDRTSIDLAGLFARGHDLLDHAGLRPWRVSLLSIISLRRKQLYDFMKANGHITETAEAQVQRLKTVLASRPTSELGITENIVERITNPFVLDLSKSAESLVFLHEECIIPYKFMTWQATTKRQTGVRFAPGKAFYSGAISLSFVLFLPMSYCSA